MTAIRRILLHLLLPALWSGVVAADPVPVSAQYRLEESVFSNGVESQQSSAYQLSGIVGTGLAAAESSSPSYQLFPGLLEPGMLPVCTGSPQISGSPIVGQTLTADSGEWNHGANLGSGELHYVWRWQRADDAAGTHWVDIPGADGSHYTVTEADRGYLLRVVVTVVDDSDGMSAAATSGSAIQAGSWTLTLLAPLAADSPLTLGMAAVASQAVAVAAGTTGPAAWLGPDDARLSRDLRQSQRWSEWRLAVAAGDTALAVNWDPETVPAGLVLLLHQVDGSGQFIPGSALDMAASRGLTVAAGTTQHFRITCAPPATHTLDWQRGWNLISLPLEPRQPQLSAIFAADLAKVYLSSVAAWENGQYLSPTELHAQRGYWLYALEAGSVPVSGGAATGRVELQPGWNLLGPAAPVATSALAAPLTGSTAWGWDGDSYHTATELHPGAGYWLFAPEPAADYPLPLLP